MSRAPARVSDRDRHRAVGRLREAFAEGRLTSEELAQRLDAALVARTEVDLAEILADLPRPPSAVTGRAAWWRRAVAFAVDELIVGCFGAVGGAVAALAGWPFAAGALIATPILQIVYFTLLHGGVDGQSFGDAAFGIAVRNADGRRATYGQAFGRTLLVMLFLTLWFLGGFLDFLWPLWDRQRQAWHDKVAGTIVVRR